jgi:hypothetical protein
VNNKQARKARAVAWQEAKRRGLFNDLSGKVDEYYKPGSLWARIALMVSKNRRDKLAKAKDSILARWYKVTVKNWAKLAFASTHDPETIAFQRVREKLLRREAHERARKAKAKAGLV